jgi:hypothetical protein
VDGTHAPARSTPDLPMAQRLNIAVGWHYTRTEAPSLTPKTALPPCTAHPKKLRKLG